MCISCGNCPTYCEMGIDVRQYAMANQSFTRASCVGCGMCVCWSRPSSSVTPRDAHEKQRHEDGAVDRPPPYGRRRGEAEQAPPQERVTESSWGGGCSALSETGSGRRWAW